jgi:hypothetical protein
VILSGQGAAHDRMPVRDFESRSKEERSCTPICADKRATSLARSHSCPFAKVAPGLLAMAQKKRAGVDDSRPDLAQID